MDATGVRCGLIPQDAQTTINTPSLACLQDFESKN
jgi:hypothetical protein